MQRLFVEIVTKILSKPKMSIDNQSAIKIIKNNEIHKQSKHIEIKFHFIRKKFQAGFFDIEYVCSEEQLADIFTKPLNRERFNYLRKHIHVKEI